MCRKFANAPGEGLGTRVHLRPFQCRIRVWPLVAPAEKPTAHALAGEVAPTPKSTFPVPGLGLASRVHFVPFQWRIRVWVPVLVAYAPTAHASVVEGAAPAGTESP